MTTAQAPISSGFGAKTTAREAVHGRDLKGSVAIVTGGYSGIGVETTRALANAGAHVIVPVRDRAKAEKTLAGILGPKVALDDLDLSDPASIDAFAKRFLASGRALPILINSAGVMACPLARDARGYEMQLAVNHIGHFQLTLQLWPALLKAKGARVISVSSRGHRITGFDFEDPFFNQRPYDKWKAYGQSKTANVLFAVALDARGERHGIRAFSLHPGAIITDLVRHLSEPDQRALGIRDEFGRVPPERAHEFKNVEEGAATQVWCATSEQLNGMGGVYCEDCDVAQAMANDSPHNYGIRSYATDPQLAERLWVMSEGWSGVKFGG